VVSLLYSPHNQPIWDSQCQLLEFSGNLLREGTKLGRNDQCSEIPSDDPHSVGNRSELPIASFIQLHLRNMYPALYIRESLRHPSSFFFFFGFFVFLTSCLFLLGCFSKTGSVHEARGQPGRQS
jgi:hypothetical protein